MTLIRDGGSFRDNSGCIVYEGEHLYRLISTAYKRDFELLHSGGLYQLLTERHWLIPHQEISPVQITDIRSFEMPGGIYKIIQPERIPFISYPSEWSFNQLKAAALLTLDIQLEALKRGMSLKDASAFNVQFRGSAPVFIDTLSFEIYEEGAPWVAYRQFCQHFLAPLLLWANGHPDLMSIQQAQLDGISLKTVSRLLPFTTRFNPFLAIHIHYHAKLTDSSEAGGQVKSSRLKLSRSKLVSIVEHLRAGTSAIQLKKVSSEWSDYYNTCSYDKKTFAQKEQILEGWLRRLSPARVLDIGCNTGHFSILAAKYAQQVIALDSDPSVIQALQVHLEKQNLCVLPLTINLCNPTPATGWANLERKSFFERVGQSDLVIAVALIHHLAIGNNIPLEDIAHLFARISKYLIIEFVPRSDIQVGKLLVSKKDIFTETYTLDQFRRAFCSCFEIMEEEAIRDSGRILFLMRTL